MGSNNSKQIHPIHSPYRRFIIGIIDVQNDFCKGGKLSVNEAEESIAAINKLRYIYDKHIRTFLSQDWHDENHMSFAERHNKKVFSGPHDLKLMMEDGMSISVSQMMWPRHCVQNTEGAKFHNDLIVTQNDIIIKKGTKKNVESYSAFGDEFNGKYEKTRLHEFLRNDGISDIILTGIASDYCVYFTALDAIRLGYTVHIIHSCTRGVGVDTTEKSFRDLKEQGVLFYTDLNEFHVTNQSILAK